MLQGRPARLDNLCITEAPLSEEFRHFCPVTLKLKRALCREAGVRAELGGKLYLLKGEDEWRAFSENPKRYLHRQQLPKTLAVRLSMEKCGELATDPKALEGYCPVTLVDEERLELGDPMLAASTGNLEFCFASYRKLRKFLETPNRYEGAALPVKMPP